MQVPQIFVLYRIICDGHCPKILYYYLYVTIVRQLQHPDGLRV